MSKTLKSLIQDSDACGIAFLSAEVNFQKNQIMPCCKFVSSEQYPTLEVPFDQTWNGEFLKDLRNNWANNVTVPGCVNCSDKTKYSFKEMKKKQMLGLLKDETLEDNVLPYNLQLSASNICNLACRMCSPQLSSTWASLKSDILFDYTKQLKIDNKNFEKYLDNLKPGLSALRTITITGGEPFMDPIVTKLIKTVKESSPNIKLISFSTNMTVYNKELFDYLASMNIHVAISVSLDGPKHIHEYIRYKCSYELIKENLKKMKEEYNFTFSINTTTSALNVGYIKEFLESIVELEEYTGIKFKQIKNGIVFNEQLRVGVLPHAVRLKYLEKLNSITYDLNLDGANVLINTAKKLLTESDPYWKDFVIYIKEFDRVANTNFEEIYFNLDNNS
jgi:sulfatase maturation enzyme AslB (radical SAM superfamily)